MRCNRCHRPMEGTTAYDGVCGCGGFIEQSPVVVDKIEMTIKDGREIEISLDPEDGEIRIAVVRDVRDHCKEHITYCTLGDDDYYEATEFH